VPSAPPSKPASGDAKTLLCNGAFPVRVLHRVCCSQREVISPVILQTPDLRRSDADIMRAPLLIRADAGCHMGIGHLMRGLALAQAWQSGGGRAVFVAETVQELSARLRSEGFEHVPLTVPSGTGDDAETTIRVAQQFGVEWVVVDGYQFRASFQETVKNAGLKLMVIDDYGHARQYCADLILNQNLQGSEDLYRSRESYSRLLLGPKYALLRREFLEWQDWKREISPCAKTMLITMGGSDPANASLKILNALRLLRKDALKTKLVIGAANQNRATLQAATREKGELAELCYDPTDTAEVMAWADMAISGAGITCWENCFMGLPAIALVLAANQQAGAERLRSLGITETLGRAEEVSTAEIARSVEELRQDPIRRAAMAKAGRKLVDGDGAARVVMHLQQYPLRLRKAQSSDCRLVWEWSNDPEARSLSFCTEPISWVTHEQWFGTKLHDPNTFLYVALDRDDEPVGQLRYDLQGREATVSVNLGRQFRGKHYGRTLLRMGSEVLFRACPAEIVHAYIKESNQRSMRAFLAAGYAHIGTTCERGQEASHLVLNRRGGA
jgi:UDP-2,4-diacetamido-2,4,6-trideoxy-beta-L-altropyranose hydrolase